MKVEVYDEIIGNERFSITELAAMSPLRFPIQERVPGAVGMAFDWKTWYKGWCERKGKNTPKPPTHLQVQASDEFQASIPWNELDQALFLYAQEDGRPLDKGFPIRLYVPDGSSACLNVKNVVNIRIIYSSNTDDDASFGFKNQITPEQLLGRNT